jgi:hypothetical protein
MLNAKMYQMAIDYTYHVAVKYTKWPWNIPHGRKIYQISIEYLYHMAAKYTR